MGVEICTGELSQQQEQSPATAVLKISAQFISGTPASRPMQVFHNSLSFRIPGRFISQCDSLQPF